MSEPMHAEPAVVGALRELEQAYERFAAATLDSCSDDEVLDVWRRYEAVRRRMAAGEYPILDEVERRGLWFTHACKSVRDFARHLLKIRPAEATARVRAAERFGRRTTPTGQSLVPVYELVAAAQRAGEISADHARVIADTIERLPDEVAAEHDVALQTSLLDHARVFDPVRLAAVAERARAHLDPDGRFADVETQQRRRYLDLHRRADGTAHVDGELTAEAAEFLETHLDALARPAPADDGERDPRTPGQRRHDGLLAMLRLVMASGQLPRTAGVTTTILLHMDAETFATGHGEVTTGHGYGIPAEVASRWAGDQARVIAVLLSRSTRVEAYSSVHRLFTEQQRLAMMARDLGCTFPTCDRTALWTEAHHVTEFRESHRTTVDDGTLLCGHDHAHFEAMGWRCVMIDGAPWWVPPDWVDPARRPVRKAIDDLPRSA